MKRSSTPIQEATKAICSFSREIRCLTICAAIRVSKHWSKRLPGKQIIEDRQVLHGVENAPRPMSADTEQRKLAAIMFTDMVGYSALAQRDDKLALELLEEHRRLLREIFPRFHGTEIKTIGDAFLVEFGSALEAAQCAIEIQRSLAKRNHDVTPDRRIELKIGIHIGDVVHREGDVYGDGVNIASRIEALAGAGGICVSMDVERQIRNALEARFEKFGTADLKNISLPMDLFRIVLPWETGGKIERTETRARKKSLSPLVAVGAAVVLVGLLFGWWYRSTRNRQNASTASPNEA